MSSHYAGPAELTTRVSGADELLVRRLYGLLPGVSPAPHRPARLVVDAHVPLSAAGSGLAAAARQAGVPFLIDPETTYLQDVQHPDAAWCKVPYANALAATPSDLMGAAAQEQLVETAIDYQITRGATQILAPYVHIESPTGGWAQVQAGLWRRTAAHVRRAGIHLPVIAVVALGWRCLHPTRGLPALNHAWAALAALHPAEVAVAASKVHMGSRPADRIAELLMLVHDLSQTYKVTLWQQGLLGEACVIEGAAGYESGIGWRDKCDLQSRMAQYRRPSSGHPGAQPVYIHELGRGVPKRRLELARSKRSVWSRLICPFPDCCSPGGDELLGDARLHSVVARARGLDELNATRAIRWRWNRLAERYSMGIDLAVRLNDLAPSSSGMPGIDLTSLRALHQVASARRGRPGVVRRTA